MSLDALRLVRADALKLRRPGLLGACALMTLGAVVAIFGVLAFQHAGSPQEHGPAGGVENFRGAMSVLALMATVVGSIVGATAGAVDLETGVFRDLAATGRPRLALYASRLGGALVVLVPLLALSVLTAGVLSHLLAGPLAAPGAATLTAGAAGVLLAGAGAAAIGVGLSALAGSRGMVIGAMLAFELAITPLLANMESLGDARQALPFVAVGRVVNGSDPALPMALGTALAVLLAWSAAGFGAGAWRTRTREI